MADKGAGGSRPLPPFVVAPIWPRAAIRQVANSTGFIACFFLFGAVGTANLVVWLGEHSVGLADWKWVLLFTLSATALSVAGFYVAAVVARLFGWLLRGEASIRTVRSALAWGSAPLAWAVLVAFLLLALQGLTGIHDFTSIAPLLVLVAGIWAIVTTIAMIREVEKFGIGKAIVTYLFAITLFFALFALTLRAFVVQPFSVPATSQAPALVVGDHFFASKYTYGYSRHSLPFSPTIFEGRLFAREPARGDIVVFKLPSDGQTDYVKRVIGLPGDSISLRGGVVSINDKEVSRTRVEDNVPESPGGSIGVPQYEETLSNGVTYRVLDENPNGMLDNVGPFQVPEGHYFMLGDNRDNSVDSRMLRQVGFVPFENLVGRAEFIFMSRSDNGSIRSERILSPVR